MYFSYIYIHSCKARTKCAHICVYIYVYVIACYLQIRSKRIPRPKFNLNFNGITLRSSPSSSCPDSIPTPRNCCSKNKSFCRRSVHTNGATPAVSKPRPRAVVHRISNKTSDPASFPTKGMGARGVSQLMLTHKQQQLLYETHLYSLFQLYPHRLMHLS